MLKHPAFRVASWSLVAPEIQESVRSILAEWHDTFTVKPEDFEITGSYARDCAQLHSDLDLNIAFGALRAEGMAALDARSIIEIRRVFWRTWALRLDMAVEAPAIARVSVKRCYRVVERKWYGTDDPKTLKRFDKWSDGTYHERQVKKPLRPPRFSFGVTDPETGDLRPGADPWENITSTWAARYGKDFLEIGKTEDTKHYGGRSPSGRNIQH
jgi:hypothetical protein